MQHLTFANNKFPSVGGRILRPKINWDSNGINQIPQPIRQSSIKFLAKFLKNQLLFYQILQDSSETPPHPQKMKWKSIEFLTKAFRNQLNSVQIFGKSFKSQLNSLPITFFTQPFNNQLSFAPNISKINHFCSKSFTHHCHIN